MRRADDSNRFVCPFHQDSDVSYVVPADRLTIPLFPLLTASASAEHSATFGRTEAQRRNRAAALWRSHSAAAMMVKPWAQAKAENLRWAMRETT